MQLPEMLEFLLDTFTNPQCDSWDFTQYRFPETEVRMYVIKTPRLQHAYGVLFSGLSFTIEGWAELVDGETWHCGLRETLERELAFRQWQKALDASMEIPYIECAE